MNHTKEPWFMTDADDSDVCIFGGDKKEWLANVGLDIPWGIADQNLIVVFDLDKANARRIVACVNACAGVKTETLEKFGGRAITAESERDAYRDMCGSLLDEVRALYYRADGRSEEIEMLIAKAEQLLGEKK